MKIRPVGDELFNVDRQTDGHDKVNSRFSFFFSKAPKNESGCETKSLTFEADNKYYIKTISSGI